MLTLTNFEDLLEKIKNIATPYECHSIKEGYEKNKDQFTPEQQQIIEEEYKKKASVLNPNSYERKVKDGARIVTIGVDLTNNGEISDINFEEFKEYIRKGKVIKPINKQHLLELIPKDLLLLSPETVDNYIQEYIIDMKKEEIDLNLLYLFARKNSILTPKGRRGFTHIRFFNENLNFYEIEDSKQVTYSFDHKGEMAYITSKNYGNETPIIKKQSFDANIKGYIHVDYDDSNNTISRVATVTFVIEHLIKNDKNFDYDYFLRNVEDFYIEWKNADNSNEKKIENDPWDIYKNRYIRKIQVEYQGKEEIRGFVTFYDFLLLTIWNEIVYPIRNSIESSKKPLDPDIFVENIKRQESFIMFKSSEIVLDKTPELENYGFKKIPDYFIEDILDFLGLRIKFPMSIFDKNYIGKIKENGFEVGNIISFENHFCGIVPLDIQNMKDFYQNIINFKEAGLKWGIAWEILLGDMVTTSATYFILYNNEIEEHLSKKKSSSKELRKITQDAIFDFEFYYDIDIVDGGLFREAFENIKDTFKLNYYHKVLLDRLQLFSNFEIAEENKEITKLLMILTGVLTGVLIMLKILPYFIKF